MHERHCILSQTRAHLPRKIFQRKIHSISTAATAKPIPFAVRRYLNFLTSAFMVRVPPPWHENIKKRQIGSTKICLKDSRLQPALLELNSISPLYGHPKWKTSFERFVIKQILDTLNIDSACLWSAQAGAKLDLFFTLDGKRF